MVKATDSPRSHISERYTASNEGLTGNSRVFTSQKKVTTLVEEIVLYVIT